MMKQLTILLAAVLIPMLLLSQNYATAVAKKGEGYYIDSENEKHEGSLKLKRTVVASFYKFTPAELSIKKADGTKDEFTLEGVKKIVIEEDTFIVVKDYELKFQDLKKTTKIVIPYDVVKYQRRGELSLKEYRYYFAADRYQRPEYWLEKGDEDPVKMDYTPANKTKMFNLFKDKPVVYKKWKYMKNSDIRKYSKKNPYQMIDDYNSAP